MSLVQSDDAANVSVTFKKKVQRDVEQRACHLWSDIRTREINNSKLSRLFPSEFIDRGIDIKQTYLSGLVATS